MKPRAHFLRVLVGQDAKGAQLVVAERGQVVADAIEAAFDSAARTRGLLGRRGLAEGAAMVIAPTNAIHTFGMQFPIDVIYAARDGCIVKLCRGLAPWRMSAALGAFCVVEMASGAIDRAALAVGEHLTVTIAESPNAQPTMAGA